VPDEVRSPSAGDAAILVGGRGRHGFALLADDVGRVVRESELPPDHRSVSLPRLFDVDVGSPEEDRFAEVRGAAVPTFVELGPDVHVRALPRDRIEPLPALLTRCGARWGWRGIVDADGLRILVDVTALASIAAPRHPRVPPTTAVPESLA
jgi:hypothetical protein